MKIVLAILLFGLALKASGACSVKRPGELPMLPDGAEASEEEMHRAQLTAENFLLQAEAYIDCRVMNHRQHEALVAQLEHFSERYDEELIEYQMRKHLVAEK